MVVVFFGWVKNGNPEQGWCKLQLFRKHFGAKI